MQQHTKKHQDIIKALKASESILLGIRCYFWWTGGLVGSHLSFNTEGLDFVMTAMFVVIFMEQWKGQILLSLAGGTICYMVLIQLIF